MKLVHLISISIVLCTGICGEYKQIVRNDSKKSLPAIDSIRYRSKNVTFSKQNLYQSTKIIENISIDRLPDHMIDEINKFGAYSELKSYLLLSIVNKELAANTIRQMLKKLNIHKQNQDVTIGKINQIADKMTQKVQDIHAAIELTGETLQEMYTKQSNISLMLDCCNPYGMNHSDNDANELQEIKIKEQQIKTDHYGFDASFHSWINKSFSCVMMDHQNNFQMNNVDLTDQFKRNIAANSLIRWQYYLTFTGAHIEYPAFYPPNNYCLLRRLNRRLKSPSNDSRQYARKLLSNKQWTWNNHHSNVYREQQQLYAQRHKFNLMAAALPTPKMIVLVLDRGSALTDHQLRIAKMISKLIVNSLSHQDIVNLVDLSSDAHDVIGDACGSNSAMANADYEIKQILVKYIDRMQRSFNSTNHYLGLQKAFQMIEANHNSFKEKTSTSDLPALIIYISRGLLSSLADARSIMQLIADHFEMAEYRMIINTYCLIDERIPIMLETIFLSGVASMDFQKFNVQPPSEAKITAGKMVTIKSTEQVGLVLESIYEVLNTKAPNSDKSSALFVSLPHQDLVSEDSYVSLSKTYYSHHGHVIGVIGMDMSLFEWAADIIHYDGQHRSYAFLIDGPTGKVIYHPLLSKYYDDHCKPLNKKSFLFMNQASECFENSFISIHLIEPELKDAHLRKMMSTLHNGKFTFKSTNNEQRAVLLNSYEYLVYEWRRIRLTDYVLVIVSNGNHSTDEYYRFDTSNNTKWFLMSDLLNSSAKNIKLCNHFNQLATMDIATVQLTQMNDSMNPSNEIHEKWSNVVNAQRIVVDNSFHSNLQVDLILVNELVKSWKQKLKEISDCSKYVIRKYIATVTGSFTVYPGSMMDKSYRAHYRPWYIRAIEEPEKIHLLPPYLDAAGSGYVVTISQAIRISETSQIWAVIGIDLTVGYFHHILDAMPAKCRQNKVSCFMADDLGYIIVHSSLPALTMMHQKHLIHKEPQMMNHLLSKQNHFVRKLVCNSYVDRSTQRYYRFNTSSADILASVQSLSQMQISCVKYMIVPLASTNTLLGMVDHSCNNNTSTFCPCSLTDRLCLNCHSLEQTDCECPCECPLLMNSCNGQFIESEDEPNPMCTILAYHSESSYNVNVNIGHYNSCVHNDCHSKLSESECKGMIGCEWCTMDMAMVRLSNPFCGNQMVCFGGVLGASNPYMSQSDDYFYRHNDNQQNMSPISPLTATLIICFIMLTFSVYCFHFQSSNHSTVINDHNSTEHRQVLQPSIQDNDGNDHIQESSSAFINDNFVQIVSPYRLNSNHSRRMEFESDHGYSTMTPNDDSEHNMPIYINPDIIRTRKKNSDSRSSIVSNDAASSVTQSCLSYDGKLNRLPPPPSASRAKSKNRCKQKFSDKSDKLTTLQERSAVDCPNLIV